MLECYRCLSNDEMQPGMAFYLGPQNACDCGVSFVLTSKGADNRGSPCFRNGSFGPREAYSRFGPMMEHEAALPFNQDARSSADDDETSSLITLGSSCSCMSKKTCSFIKRRTPSPSSDVTSAEENFHKQQWERATVWR